MPLGTVTTRATNTREVMLGLWKQLADNLGDIFPAETIFLSDPDEWQAGAPEQQITTEFLCVCGTDADLPEETQIGGGQFTTFKWGGFAVYIFTDSRLGQVGHQAAALYDPEHGLYELERRVMRALVGSDPVGDNALPLLAELTPARSSFKPRRNENGLWFMKLEFGAGFLWDLS